MPEQTAAASRRPTSEPRWLTDREQQAWRRLAAVILKLPSELEAQLQSDADMSHFEYWVIAILSETPARSLRLSELANHANASLSRLSHVVTRLEKRGWVVRRPCPDDGRASLAVLTDDGWDAVVAAAPGHVAAVRKLVFDGLSRTQVDDLARVCDRILEHLDCPPQG